VTGITARYTVAHVARTKAGRSLHDFVIAPGSISYAPNHLTGLYALREFCYIPCRSRKQARIGLLRYPFYYAALGEFELRDGQHEAAAEHFHHCAGTGTESCGERHFLEQRIRACESTSRGV